MDILEKVISLQSFFFTTTVFYLYFHVEYGILAFAKFKSPTSDCISEKMNFRQNFGKLQSPNPVMLPKNENKKKEIVED